MANFKALRQQRHAQWLKDLRQQLQVVVTLQAEAIDGSLQIWLFGSRSRGDWDGYSDTDLLVVSPLQKNAQYLANQLLNEGLAQDVIAISEAQWLALPKSESPIWRAIAEQAVLLLDQR